MKLFRKILIIPSVFVFAFILAGCSNPQSKKEAQKLLEKQAKVLEDRQQVEKADYKIKSVSDSLKNEQLKLIERKDEVKHDLNTLNDQDENLSSDIKTKKQVELNEQIEDLEKKLENLNLKITQVEHRDSVLNKAKDTIYVQRQIEKKVGKEKLQTAEENNDTDLTYRGIEKNSKPEESDKKIKSSEEQMLEILEGKKNTRQKKENVYRHDSVKVNEVETNTDLSDINKKTKVLKDLDNEITVKREEIDSLKEKVANEANKLVKKHPVVKEKKAKGVSKMTKAITIIIAIALVMFIVLYLLGKQGLSKQKSQNK